MSKETTFICRWSSGAEAKAPDSFVISGDNIPPLKPTSHEVDDNDNDDDSDDNEEHPPQKQPHMMVMWMRVMMMMMMMILAEKVILSLKEGGPSDHLLG